MQMPGADEPVGLADWGITFYPALNVVVVVMSNYPSNPRYAGNTIMISKYT